MQEQKSEKPKMFGFYMNMGLFLACVISLPIMATIEGRKLTKLESEENYRSNMNVSAKVTDVNNDGIDDIVIIDSENRFPDTLYGLQNGQYKNIEWIKADFDSVQNVMKKKMQLQGELELKIAQDSIDNKYK